MTAVPEKKLKILVVDDNDVFRGALKITLEQEGYEVTVAENGRVAQDIVGLGNYAAVISDIKMTPVDGIQLLHHIKTTMKVPVILMTGFSELMETQEAAMLGADGFLAKPFKSEDLMQVLRPLIGKKELSQSDPMPVVEDYSKISIDDFVSGHEMKFDIFIRVSEGKYLKVAHQGEDIPLERVKSYKSKGLTHLYMRREDFRSYLGFSLTLSVALKGSESISKEKRMHFMKHTGELIMEQLFSDEIKNEDFEWAKTIVETTVELLSESSDLLEMLTALNSHSDFLYAHSLGVSLYSAMIAKEMKWTSPSNIYKVSTGGLLHDIGKKEIERNILEKSRIKLTTEEVRLLETHSTRGMEILSNLPSIPSDILQIVAQHHENVSGTGYPMHLKKGKTHPFARLIATANEFCNLAIKNPNSPGLTPKEAFHKLNVLHAQNLDPVFFQALGRIIEPSLAAASRKAS